MSCVVRRCVLFVFELVCEFVGGVAGFVVDFVEFFVEFVEDAVELFCVVFGCCVCFVVGVDWVVVFVVLVVDDVVVLV